MSTDIRHTPGPWGLSNDEAGERYEIGINVEGGVEIIASLDYGFSEPFESQQHANARLILAAPDLLALAKQHASECLDCNYGDGATGKGSEGDPCEECADIRAVIDRAEGRL